MFPFEKLEVYQKAIGFSTVAYKLSQRFPSEEMFALSVQLKRASVSVAANIAEGNGRTRRDYIHFLTISRTSVYECVALSRIALDQGYITQADYQAFYEKCESLAQMLSALIRALRKKT